MATTLPGTGWGTPSKKASFVTMEFAGGQDMMRALKALGTDALIKSVVRSANKKALASVVARAREIAPKTTVPHREGFLPGAMAKSIASRHLPVGFGGEIATVVSTGPKIFYAHMIEFGTKNIPGGIPFLRPAWDEKQGEIVDSLRTELWAAIERTRRRVVRRQAR